MTVALEDRPKQLKSPRPRCAANLERAPVREQVIPLTSGRFGARKAAIVQRRAAETIQHPRDADLARLDDKEPRERCRLFGGLARIRTAWVVQVCEFRARDNHCAERCSIRALDGSYKPAYQLIAAGRSAGKGMDSRQAGAEPAKRFLEWECAVDHTARLHRHA